MKSIEILGPGCAKCLKLAENADNAAKELGIEYTLKKVTDINDIMAYGIMMTPGFVVDGVVINYGRLLTVKEIKEILSK